MPVPVVCTVLGWQHHLQHGIGKGLEQPSSMARLVRSDCSVASACVSRFIFYPHTVLLLLMPQKNKLCTASHVHYAVSHLCAFAHVCLSGCPSHLSSSQSLLLILQDNVHPSPSPGRLPQAFRLGPTLLLAQHVSIAVAHQIILTLCALSTCLLSQSKEKILVNANHKTLCTSLGSINDYTCQGGNLHIHIQYVKSLLNSFLPLLHILRIIYARLHVNP